MVSKLRWIMANNMIAKLKKAAWITRNAEAAKAKRQPGDNGG
jgi:hypothetical protein